MANLRSQLWTPGGLFQEILPFITFVQNRSIMMKRVEVGYILQRIEYREYATLPVEDLMVRLREEFDRAARLDDKTFKLTLSWTIALAVVGVAIQLYSTGPYPELYSAVTIVGLIALVYLLIGAVVALGGVRTMNTYGYGTQVLLGRGSENYLVQLASDLARQETMNLIRHGRNECSYQCLRNGLFTLFLAIALYFVASSEGLCAGLRLPDAANSELEQVNTLPAHRQLDHAVQLAQ